MSEPQPFAWWHERLTTIDRVLGRFGAALSALGISDGWIYSQVMDAKQAVHDLHCEAQRLHS